MSPDKWHYKNKQKNKKSSQHVMLNLLTKLLKTTTQNSTTNLKFTIYRLKPKFSVILPPPRPPQHKNTQFDCITSITTNNQLYI